MNEPTPTHVKEAAEDIALNGRGDYLTIQAKIALIEEILLKHLPQSSECETIAERYELALRAIEGLDVGKETVDGVISRMRFIAHQALAEVQNGHHAFSLPQPPTPKEKV